MNENKTININKEDAAATAREKAATVWQIITVTAERAAENKKDIDKMRDIIAELTAAVNKINDFIANLNKTFLNNPIKRVEEGSPKK